MCICTHLPSLELRMILEKRPSLLRRQFIQSIKIRHINNVFALKYLKNDGATDLDFEACSLEITHKVKLIKKNLLMA